MGNIQNGIPACKGDCPSVLWYYSSQRRGYSISIAHQQKGQDELEEILSKAVSG